MLWIFEYLPSHVSFAGPLRNRDRPLSSFLDGTENQFYDMHVIDCVFRSIENEVTGWGFSFEELKSCLNNAIPTNRNV